MRAKWIFLIMLGLCAPLGWAQQSMTNDSVVKLVKSGVSDEIILTAIQGSPAQFDTSADALVALKAAGASNQVLAAVLLKAQNVPVTPMIAPAPVAVVTEPETMGKIFYLDPATKQLKRLPGEQWKRKLKQGFASVKSVDIIAGEKSSLRVSSKEKVVLVIRPFSDQVLESGVRGIQIYPLDVKDGERSCVIAEVHGRTSTGNKGVIAVDAVRYGATSYALTPTSGTLPPGEYWVHLPGSSGVNDPLLTFGVD